MIEQPTLGQLLSGNERRDAVHVAIAPVQAGTELRPGQRIGLLEGKAYANAETIGIVDPFLVFPVPKGEWFYLWLYPNTVTSLRHVWTHPAFTPKPPKGNP